MVVSIGGDRQSLWQAVESEGEVLDLLVQSRRDKKSAMRLMRTLLRKQGFASPRIDCLIVGLGGSRQQEHAMLSET